MRCKSCNAELARVDLTRKEADESFVDLCTPCWNASEAWKYELVTEVEEMAEDTPPAPQEGPQGTFDRYIEKHNLRSSWADGLGLRMTGEQRMDYFYDKCYGEYLDLLASGYGSMVALERACGIHRGDKRREYSGASFGWTPTDAPTDGFVPTSDLER